MYALDYSSVMVDARALFQGKRVTLMGLGLLGRGVGDVAFLAEQGASVLVTDMKSETELAESIAALKKYPNISFRLGGHREEDFTQCDMVVKAAGVPLDSPFIARSRAAGIEIVMSTALFARLAREAGAVLVGVTGTRGKSTIAHMIHHILSSEGRRVHLGGNIRGLSTLALLPQVHQGDTCVLELDSWQLQGFGDMGMSPHIAVFTNFMPDHQNYYPDMDAYFADKANIFRFQKPGDSLFIDASVRERVEHANPPVAPVVPPALSPEIHLKVLGAHNRANASLAAAALRVLDLSEESIRAGLESFAPVEGRLQFVRSVRGVRIYNDNNATTPEATIAALNALEGRRVVLIMGGADKGLDMSALVSEIHSRCKGVYFLAGTGTDAIRSVMPDTLEYTNVAEALQAALSQSDSGDIILFSPAFASFGLFKNEYERNDAFMSAVARI